jgi:hypothetical protein
MRRLYINILMVDRGAVWGPFLRAPPGLVLTAKGFGALEEQSKKGRRRFSIVFVLLELWGKQIGEIPRRHRKDSAIDSRRLSQWGHVRSVAWLPPEVIIAGRSMIFEEVAMQAKGDRA